MVRRDKDENLRSEMVSILYDQNVLGFKGRFKMQSYVVFIQQVLEK